MKILLDEQLSTVTAQALHPVVAHEGHAVEHLVTMGHGGTPDDDIPALCAEAGYSALISVNVKDFGARLHYFTALLDAGVSVSVVRPSKVKLDIGGQVGLIAPRLTQMIATWSSSPKPVLFVVTPGGVRERSLDELIEQIESS